MYDKIIGAICKIVFLDGNKISVIRGKILDWDENIKTIYIKTSEGRELYIAASQIQKLELNNEPNNEVQDE